MWLVEHLAGVAEGHFLLADYPDEMADLFAEIHRGLLERVTILAEHSPADTLWLTENTSTTLISPEQYRTLDKPLIAAYADAARAHGKRFVLHMCGKIKALLGDLAEVGATAFEAFTAPPLGDTTLLDGRRACPDVCLIGGTHARLWEQPAEGIIDFLRTRLDELPHHRGLVITSAGVLPPTCEPETLRDVCEWVRSYPVRC